MTLGQHSGGHPEVAVTPTVSSLSVSGFRLSFILNSE